MSDPFALDDVAGDAPALAALPDEALDRLAARWSWGAAPLAAGAELARRRHRDANAALSAMVGAAAFVAPDDLPVLLGAGDAGVDALAAVALASAVPVQTREIAAELLGGERCSTQALARHRGSSPRPKKPPRAHAGAAALGRAETNDARGATPRCGPAGARRGARTLYRQEFQRAMARARRTLCSGSRRRRRRLHGGPARPWPTRRGEPAAGAARGGPRRQRGPGARRSSASSAAVAAGGGRGPR
ncbi:MAG: hypothetical protein R3A52_14155 [Polyangiales bacterium]